MTGRASQFCSQMCIIATVALVSWQVMIPNEENDVKAIYSMPLSQWGHEGHFNTLNECLAYREEIFRQADMIEQTVGRKIAKWEIVRAAKCISTDDPRLQKK